MFQQGKDKAAKMECALFGMGIFWNVPFLECDLFGMCLFWYVLFLERVFFGMFPICNVPFLECALFGMFQKDSFQEGKDKAAILLHLSFTLNLFVLSSVGSEQSRW